MLFGEVVDRDRGAFAREQHGDGPADAGVATRDQGDFAVELARGLVRVGLVPRLRRELGFEPRRVLMLLRGRAGAVPSAEPFSSISILRPRALLLWLSSRHLLCREGRAGPQICMRRASHGTSFACHAVARERGRVSMSPSGLWPLIKMSVVSWRKDHASSMGGALAYYTLFSIAPVLIIVIAVAGFFFGAEAARGEIVTQLRGLLGDDGATAVQGLLESASEPEEGLFATVSSIALLLLGATTVFAELQSDLDRIWRAEAAKPLSGLWALLRARLLSFGMVLALAFLLLVSLVMSAALAALGKWWGGLFEGWAVLLEILNFVVVVRDHDGTFRPDLQILAAGGHRLARRVDRRRGDRAAVHDRQVPHRALHRPQRHRFRIRRGRLVRRLAGVGLLLDADLLARRGVHLGIRARARIEDGQPRPGAQRTRNAERVPLTATR